MQNQAFPTLIQAGDSGIMVVFGDSLDLAINNAAHAFDAALRARKLPEVEEITPGIRSVLVRFDPLRSGLNNILGKLESLLDQQDWLLAPANPDRKVWKLPAHYGEQSGPDLENVAKLLAMPVDRVIREHSEARVRVLMLGFAPGCAYLGSLPQHWDLPRLDYVKAEVPPGSMSVAVRQTVLFATPIPTGWQTIARTPFLSFCRDQAPYFFLGPGDEVTFEPVDHQTFLQLAADVAAGKMIVQPGTAN